MNDRSERFFAWVWRINGLLVLILAIVGLTGAFALIINIGIFATRERPEQKLTEVAGADLGGKDLRLTDFYPIKGTHLLYAQLAPLSEYIGSGSSGGRGSPNNLLFFDTITKKVHWLLPGNDQVIHSFAFLTDPPSNEHRFDDSKQDGDPVTIAILLEVEDTRRGQGISRRGARRLAVTTSDGRSITKLAESVEGILGHHQVSKHSTFVFYVSGGSARVLDMDPVARVVRSDGFLAADERRLPD